MTATNAPQLVFVEKQNLYQCKGNWSILTLAHFLEQFEKTDIPAQQQLTISGQGVGKFDSAGALTLLKCINRLENAKNNVELLHFSDEQQHLLSLVKEKNKHLRYSPPPPPKETFLYQIGKQAVHKAHQASGLIILIGDITEKLLAACKHFHRFHFLSIINTIHKTGVTALPIIGLLSFLIGVVLAYQMGIQLETYGANIFIAYLSGMAIFREFAPLITAIIVAGRTSSSFTAQIGSMKINEELDALHTMGLSPTELLVTPRLLGLLLVFPLLIFWSNFFSILGAMIMSKLMLDVGYMDFLTRLQESVGLKQLLLGLYKAPAFSILIALVGCFQGFQVEFNADSVGTKTTKSVVQALFLIIIADAAYSVIYSWLDL